MAAFADAFKIREPVQILKMEDKKKIHEAALDVMASVGVRIHSSIARSSLRKVGAEVDERTGVVKFAPDLVKSLVSEAPSSYVLAGREREFDLPLDGRHCYYTTDGCGVAVWDQKTRTRRLSVMQDIKNTVVIGDYLPYCSIYEPMVVPSDIPEKVHVISAMKEAFDTTRKHIHSESTTTPEEARLQVKMASEIVGSVEELRKRPIMSAMVCTMSPLTLDGNATDAAMVWAENKIPVCITGMAMMGVSAPATIPGDLVINHAETLALTAAMQAHSAGAPVMYGSVLSNMDPRTGAIRLGSAEALMLCVHAHEMAKYVNLPSACGGIGSNAKIPGPQASLENSSMAIAGVWIGQEVNNGLGMLDCSTVLSYEQLVLDNETVGRALACGRELVVNKDTVHLDMIKEVGILGIGKKKGSFLGERATMMEARQFYQSFFTSEPYEQWAQMGKKDDLLLAKEKADWILKNHRPVRLDKDISERLGRIVKEAAKA